jgi:hypothetical protein
MMVFKVFNEGWESSVLWIYRMFLYMSFMYCCAFVMHIGTEYKYYVVYYLWLCNVNLNFVNYGFFIFCSQGLMCVLGTCHVALCTLRCQCLNIVNYKILGPICQLCICFMLWICHVFPCWLNVRSIDLLHMSSIVYKVDCLVLWVSQMFFCGHLRSNVRFVSLLHIRLIAYLSSSVSCCEFNVTCFLIG